MSIETETTVKIKKTFALATGGTGGHIFPAYALAETLTKRGHKVFFMTDERCKERYATLLKDYELFIIPSKPPVGSFLSKIRSLFAIVQGVMCAGNVLYEKRPHAVIGFGGYPSFPTMFAATNRKFPTIIHEQNAYMGKANRYFLDKVSFVATSFHKVSNLPSEYHHKTKNVGNPIRSDIGALSKRPYPMPNPREKLHILVLGGSLGASIFAKVIPDAMALITPEIRQFVHVTQQCRPGEEEGIMNCYKQSDVSYEISTFYDNVPELLARTHLLFARAGASTVAEATAAGVPTVYIPYPNAAEDHQTKNAIAVAEMEGGWIIPESEFTIKRALEECNNLLSDLPRLQKVSQAAKDIARKDSAKELADLVESVSTTYKKS